MPQKKFVLGTCDDCPTGEQVCWFWKSREEKEVEEEKEKRRLHHPRAEEGGPAPTDSLFDKGSLLEHSA